MRGRRGERGAALVVTLVFAAAMSAAAVAFLETRRNDRLAFYAQAQAVEAEAMLDAALQQTAALIANRSERQIIPGKLSWTFGDAQVEVLIESEAGKIDLNTAEEALLQGLPLALGLEDDRAAAFAQTILDWRDENSEKSNQGAEDRDYDREEHGSSGAGDRPFAHPAELRYLPAVDGTVWTRLAPLVTVYSGNAGPDQTKAPEPVRRAMAIARGLAPASADETEPTSDRERTSEDEAPDPQASRPVGTTEGPGLGQGQPGLSGSDAAEGGDEDAGEAGTETSEAAGVHAVFLDVRFPNGYEAAARAVIGLGGGAQDARAFTVLDWTPVLREQSRMP
jgi:general secretion pathway protein K